MPRQQATTLNVLHAIPSMSPHWGGPVAVVSQLIPALSDMGINCEIATTEGHRVGNDITTPPGIPTHSFETQLPARLWTAYSSSLARFLNENIARFDIVHVHEIWHYAGYAAYRAARRNGVPFVLTPHGELDEWRLRHKAWKKRIYMRLALDGMLRQSNALHAITNAERDRIEELGYDTHVTVAPNGINPVQFDELPDPSILLDSFPTLRSKQVVLFLGRLNPTKGLDVLAHSFSRVAKRFPHSALLLAGPDEEGGRRLMETILKSEGVLDRTVFTGMLTGEYKLAALACADLFVLPSYSEGFSIAVLEAMAARLPVVITEGCNFPEVTERDAGFVVEAKDAPVAEAISTLLSDPGLRAKMGENGRNLVAERYTWQATASKIADLYRSLAARKSHWAVS